MPEASLTMNVEGLLTSRELARFFQEEFSTRTGLQARWAADRVHSVKPLDRRWSVPFVLDGSTGTFGLAWDQDFERYLASRASVTGAQPSYLGGILRAAAGRWSAWSGLHGSSTVRLLPSPDEVGQASGNALRAALIVDSFVLELSFDLAAPSGPALA